MRFQTSSIFKTREKHPWISVVFNKSVGVHQIFIFIVLNIEKQNALVFKLKVLVPINPFFP